MPGLPDGLLPNGSRWTAQRNLADAGVVKGSDEPAPDIEHYRVPARRRRPNHVLRIAVRLVRIAHRLLVDDELSACVIAATGKGQPDAVRRADGEASGSDGSAASADQIRRGPFMRAAENSVLLLKVRIGEESSLLLKDRAVVLPRVVGAAAKIAFHEMLLSLVLRVSGVAWKTYVAKKNPASRPKRR